MKIGVLRLAVRLEAFFLPVLLHFTFGNLCCSHIIIFFFNRKKYYLKYNCIVFLSFVEGFKIQIWLLGL